MRASSARYCITPKGEFYLIGYGPRYESRKHPATGVHDDIYLTINLLEIDNKRIYLVNADIIEFEEEMCLEIKDELHKLYGIDQNLVLLSATHDHHSVMSYHKHWNTGEFNQSYYDYFKETVIKGYADCEKTLCECEGYFGKGEVEGFYGSRIYYGEKADNEVILVEFRDSNNHVVAAICNWATHSTVLDPENTLLTADFAGAVREKIHETRGYYPLMIVGAAGDCSNRAFRKGTDYAELDRVATGVANQLNKIACDEKLNIKYEKDTYVTYDVDYQPQVDTVSVSNEIKELESKMEKATNEQDKKLLYDAANSLRRKLDTSRISIVLFSTIIKLGDLEIVTSPGELGSKLGKDIKQNSKSKCCLVFGYTNGYRSYILQKELKKDSARSQGSKYRDEDVDNYMSVILTNM